MKKEFEVKVNDKVVNLLGDFIGNKFCVDLSSVDKHPALSQKEKENLKRTLRNDKSLFTK